MTSQTTPNLKGVFEQGDKPQGSDYANLIDSFVSNTDTTAQTMASDLSLPNLIATTKVSSPAGNFALVSASSMVVTGRVSADRGTAMIIQRATLLSTNTAGAPVSISLPSGSNVVDFWVDVETPFATGAGVTAADITMSAANGVTLAKIAVSASTKRYNTSNAQTVGSIGYRNVTATIEAYVSIQGSATALSAGQAMLTVVYVR